MIYFVLVDYFCLSVYFGVAKVTAKIVQMSEKTSSLLECFSECSLSYEKIVQANGMTKQNTQFLFFIPERSLSYEKIVQMSEKTSSLLECFSECSLSYEKIVQASGMTKQNTQFFVFHSRAPPIL